MQGQDIINIMIVNARRIPASKMESVALEAGMPEGTPIEAVREKTLGVFRSVQVKAPSHISVKGAGRLAAEELVAVFDIVEYRGFIEKMIQGFVSVEGKDSMIPHLINFGHAIATRLEELGYPTPQREAGE